MAHINSDILRLGVDVGSTTVKAVALDPADNSVLFTRYQRHNAHQADTVRQLLEEAAGHFPGMRFRIGVCGSGGRPIAAALGACYVQEVVANAAAVRALYPEVRTAVELGGQDSRRSQDHRVHLPRPCGDGRVFGDHPSRDDHAPRHCRNGPHPYRADRFTTIEDVEERGSFSWKNGPSFT